MLRGVATLHTRLYEPGETPHR